MGRFASYPLHEDSRPLRPKPTPKGRRNLQTTEMAVTRVEVLVPELKGRADRVGLEVSYQLGYERGGARCIAVARVKYKLSNIDTTEIVVAEALGGR